MKIKTVAIAVGVAALLAAGLTFGITEASASGPNVTSYACLYKGKLTHVGTVAPICPSAAQQIAWNSQGPPGTNGTNGTPSNPGTSVTSSALNSGKPDCTNGGSSFTSASATTYACNGEDGSQGLPATNGMTHAYGTSSPLVMLNSLPGFRTAILNWNPTLPGEDYVLTANVNLNDQGGQVATAQCQVEAPFLNDLGGNLYVQSQASVEPGGNNALALTGFLTLPQGTVNLSIQVKCWELNATFVPMNVSTTLLAVAVNAVN